MAALTPLDRLQPALLDRLTDDDPTTTSEPREQRLVGRKRMREAVLRDLAWLFNATQMTGDLDWRAYPHAQRSVVNYGLPALSGETASSLDVVALEASVRRVILDFEPRIIASTLKVTGSMSDDELDHHNVVSFTIAGHIWAQPVPLELLLRTEVDLESGQVQISDVGR